MQSLQMKKTTTSHQGKNAVVFSFACRDTRLNGFCETHDAKLEKISPAVVLSI